MTPSTESYCAFGDTYGHPLVLEPTADGGVALHIGASPHMEPTDRSLHLDMDQATILRDALRAAGTTTFDPEETTSTPRGFLNYGTVHTTTGITLVVRESSAAMGPHVWVFQKDANGESLELGRDVTRLDATQAGQLAAALDNHIATAATRWG